MRILYITTKATYGGVQTHIKQCAEYMKNRGNDVAVMAHPSTIPDFGLEVELKKIGVTFYPNKFLRNAYNPITGILAIIKIRKTINFFKPDLVSCHSSAAGFWGRLAVMNKIPIIFTAHGWGFSPGVDSFQGVVVKITEKLVSQLCRKIICVSVYDMNLAINNGITRADKLITIHNGVESKIHEGQDESRISQKGDKNTPIVFLSRLSMTKNPEQLIEALALLPENLQSKAHVYIIGDGPKRGMLEDLIHSKKLGDKVSLMGEMPRMKLLTFLSNCIKESSSGGIFTLISQYEGLPRSILEGMMLGFAIVATDVGGVSEEVNEDVGILIKRNDTVSLKNSLEFLLNNPEKIKQLGERAKEKAFKEFSLQEMLTKTEEVYKSLVHI